MYRGCGFCQVQDDFIYIIYVGMMSFDYRECRFRGRACRPSARPWFMHPFHVKFTAEFVGDPFRPVTTFLTRIKTASFTEQRFLSSRPSGGGKLRRVNPVSRFHAVAHLGSDVLFKTALRHLLFEVWIVDAQPARIGCLG